MAEQKGLFANLPQFNNDIREKNKVLVGKSGKPASSKTRSVIAGAGKNKLAERISILRQNVKDILVEEGKYQLITTEVEYCNYMQQARANGLLVIDTEGTSLEPLDDVFVGLCIVTPGLKPAYVPVRHTDLRGVRLPNQLSEEIVGRELTLCAEADTKLVFHYAKYDIRVIRKSLGVYLEPYWDTQIAACLLNENEPHELKKLWSKYIAKNTDKKDVPLTFEKLFSGIPFNYVPVDIGYLYAAKDPEMTYDLYEYQREFLIGSKAEAKGLTEVGKVMMNIEMPLVTVLCDMEDTGVCIDNDFASKLSKEYTEKLQVVEKKILVALKGLNYQSLPNELRAKLSNPINVGSPTQLAIIFYDLMGLKSPNKKKPRNTDKEALKHFKQQDGDLFDLLLEYRTVSKLLSTYIDKMPKVVRTDTSRLHGNFNQYGAKTGRLSSSAPNLQNIPSKNKEIRKMFVPAPGNVYVGGDFSQVEPRCLAEASGDKAMQQAYRDGLDIYAWMASETYGVPYDHCKENWPDGTPHPEGKKRRDSLKSVLLGIMYDRQVPSIAIVLGISTADAQRIFDMFFERFPDIKRFVEDMKEMGHTKGFVQTLYGRKRRLTDLQLPKYEITMLNGDPVDDTSYQYYYRALDNSRFNERAGIVREARAQGVKIRDNGGFIAKAERQVVNSIIQGTSADITKKAMVAINRDKKLRELGARMLLTVHDEIILECPISTAQQCASIMEKHMLAAADRINLPMSVDAEIKDKWYGKTVEFETEDEDDVA